MPATWWLVKNSHTPSLATTMYLSFFFSLYAMISTRCRHEGTGFGGDAGLDRSEVAKGASHGESGQVEVLLPNPQRSKRSAGDVYKDL